MDISSVVDYIPVLDRLTCDYVMPEAKKVLEETYCMKNHQPTQTHFESSLLSSSIPNLLAYNNIEKYMGSPQHQVRYRGCTPSFEKQLKLTRSRSVPRMSKEEIKEFMNDFLKRDNALNQQKQAEPKPLEIYSYISPKSEGIAIRKRKQIKIDEKQKEAEKAEAELQETEKRQKKIVEQRQATIRAKKMFLNRSVSKPKPVQQGEVESAKIEISMVVKQIRQTELDVQKIDNRDDYRHTIDARTLRLAKRAEKSRKKRNEEAALRREPPKKEKPQHLRHAIPSYLRDYSEFRQKTNFSVHSN